jgi:single-strand DNA-binding protein
MAGWSQTIIVGNVGRDVNFKYTQSGVPVADFSVAVTRRFGGRDGAEKQEKTTWYKVTCWRNLAEIANQYVRKGMQVMVVGQADVSSYLDKAGQPAASLELTADNFQMLGGRGDSEGRANSGGGGNEYGDYAPAPPDSMGDIPF